MGCLGCLGLAQTVWDPEVLQVSVDSVDGRDPAPVDMENLPIKLQGFTHLRWLAGFLPSTVRPDLEEMVSLIAQQFQDVKTASALNYWAFYATLASPQASLFRKSLANLWDDCP